MSLIKKTNELKVSIESANLSQRLNNDAILESNRKSTPQKKKKS